MADDARLEEIVQELAKVQPCLRDEPQAYARARIRMGFERGVLEAIMAVSKRDFEFDRILALSDEEVLEEARAQGLDTAAYAERMREFVRRAIKEERES